MSCHECRCQNPEARDLHRIADACERGLDVLAVLQEIRHDQRWLVDRVTELTATINRLETRMAGELQALQEKVAETTTVVESAITLIQGIKAALDAAIASGDPAALVALSDQLGAENQRLSDAIVANTPAAKPIS